MRVGIGRLGVGAAALVVLLVSGMPRTLASDRPSGTAPHVFLFTIQVAGLSDLMGTAGFLGLAQHGGAGVLVSAPQGSAATELRRAFGRARGAVPGVVPVDLGSVADRHGRPSAAKLDAAARQVADTLKFLGEDSLVFVAAEPVAPIPGDLGAVVMAEGIGSDLAAAIGRPGTAVAGSLTSDSTRRDGVVTSADVAHTAIAAAGTSEQTIHDVGGAQIRVVPGPPPTGLVDRYAQYRRLTVPIGTAAALYVTIGGLLAVLALAWRRSPRWLRAITAGIAISAPVLALALLLVGHLPSLTAASVVTFLVAVTALGTLALVPIARRRGSLTAIAVAGSGLLIAFAIEAALGWTAALTPMLGGSQLDGGRFFGLPNAFIGLLLGGSVYVAQRLPRVWGTALIAAVGLFAGSPWTGSNIGAAVTLFAGAGIWWGLRGEQPWTRTVAASAVSVLAGTGLVVFAHRYLTSAPTHITRFAESTGGIAGLWHKLVDRLGVGVDLIRANPFALVPVIGVIATLVLVLRPTPPVRITFVEAPVWKAALLTIVIASLFAYLVNDSGAAAIGEGFTTSLAALLYVSLLRRNGIMEEA